MKSKRSGFGIIEGKGFHITFENGWTASVQFGPYNYCGDYPDSDKEIVKKSEGLYYQPNAEVACWNREGEWQRPKLWGKDYYDDVKGYQTPAEVLELLNWVASQ